MCRSCCRMPAADQGVCAPDSSKAVGPRCMAGQDQPIGGRKTGVIAVGTIPAREGTAGTVTSRCRAANGRTWTIATTGNMQAQSHPDPVPQSQSAWAEPPWPGVAPSSQSWSAVAGAAVPAAPTWPALLAAMALEAHSDMLPSRQNATISRQRSSTPGEGIGFQGSRQFAYDQITRSKTGCQRHRLPRGRFAASAVASDRNRPRSGPAIARHELEPACRHHRWQWDRAMHDHGMQGFHRMPCAWMTSSPCRCPDRITHP